MANYLVYWKTYWQDREDGDDAATPAWYTDNEGFHEKARENDKLWVVINGGADAPNEWRLLQRFIVSRVTPKPLKSLSRRYEIVGKRNGNLVFDPANQPDFAAILRMLKFSTGVPILTVGAKIGQSLQTQGHRTLTEKDVVLLEDYIKTLKTK